MKSRVIPAIGALVEQPNWSGTRDDVAAVLHCDPKTAYRVLTDLWLNGNLYVKSWVRREGSPIQVFAKRTGRQRDAMKPSPRTSAECNRELRKDPFIRETHNANNRKYRATKKALSGETRIGVWGL